MHDISEERKAFYIAQYKLEHDVFISDLAKRFNLSRDIAYRNFQKAKELGLFKVKYYPPKIIKVEEELKEALALTDVFIAEKDDSVNNQMKSVAFATNWYINRYMTNDIIVSIGGGRTLREFVDVFKPDNPHKRIKSVEVYTLNNDIITKGKGELPTYVSSFVAGEFNLRLIKANIGASYMKFHISELHGRKEKEIHVNECEDCRNIVTKIKKSDMVIVGIGILKKGVDSTTMKFLKTCNVDVHALIKNGVVGEVAHNAYTEDGKSITALEDYVISLSFNELKKLTSDRKRKKVIGVACGQEKAVAIIGAARAKLINRLIIDEQTAHKIIEMLQNHSSD